MNKYNSGFAALISAIIISVTLVIVVLSLGLTGFFARANILDAEYKEISMGLAQGCVNAAILKLANDATYVPVAGGETIVVEGTNSCKILSVNGAGVNKTIAAQGIYPPNAGSYSNLKVVITLGGTSIPIVSWEEVANLP